MKNQYKQLTQVERYQIEALCKRNYSARYIAKELKRSNKTISTELARCLPYSAERANEMSKNIRDSAKKRTKCDDKMTEKIRKLLLLPLTPELISGRMKLENYPDRICTNTIYRLI